MAEFRINVTVDPTKAEAGAKRVRGALDRTTKNADRLRATLVRAFAVLGGAGVLVGAVRTIAQFEQAISTVGAVTSATAAQLERLNRTALDLGARTRFSATQAAEGMTFLARAGFSVDEVLSSIEGTLQLAQAGMLDLGTAADIASNVLTGFRLDVSETARVVDVLAKAANSSNTNIQQLGDGFKLVGPIAAGVGTEFEEVIAALGALADAGLQGTLGGTGLRRVISELESPATKTLEILGSLGLSSEQYRISTVGLVGALEALAKAGVDTGQALEIFGDRGGPAFEVLSSSIPRVKELAQALRDAGGTAEQIARLMDDNLNGALLRVRSAYEAVVLAFGQEGGSSVLRTGLEGLADILRAVARNIGFVIDAATALTLALAAPKLAAIAAGLTGAGAAATVLERGLLAARVAARLLLRAVAIGFVIEGISYAIEEIGRLNAVVQSTPATWGDAATVAADRFANNLLGGLDAVARGIPNLLRIITDPIVAAFRVVGEIIGETIADSVNPANIGTRIIDDISAAFLRGIAPPEIDFGKTVAAAKRTVASIIETFEGIRIPSFGGVVDRIEAFFADIELPTLVLPDISLPSFGEIVDRIEAFFEDIELPTLVLPDIDIPRLGEIVDRIIATFEDIDLPTLTLPDISLPRVGEIAARIQAFFEDIELPTLHLPDISLPSLGEIADRIERFFDRVELPTLHLPDFSLPRFGEIADRILAAFDDIDLPTLALPDISLPRLGAVADRILAAFDDIELPTLSLPDISLPSLGEIVDRIESYFDDIELPTLVLPDISLPTFAEIRARIERTLDFDLPTLVLPDISLPSLADIRARIERAFDFELPTLHLPDISLPSLADIRARIDRTFDGIDLPTLHLPDISLPSFAEIRARIDRAFDGVTLPTLVLPDISLPTRAGIIRSIDQLLSPETLGLPDLGINFELPTLANIKASVLGLIERIPLPSLDIGFELPTLADVQARIDKFFSGIRIPNFLSGIFGGSDAAAAGASAGAAGGSEFDFSGTEAFPDAVNFGSGLGERVGTAMREAWAKALERTGDDFTGSLGTRFVKIATDEQIAAFDDSRAKIEAGATETTKKIADETAAAIAALSVPALTFTDNQAKALERLRDAYDPIGAAARELAAAQDLLAVAVATGNIGLEAAHALSQQLTKSYQDQLDPLKSLIDEYNREISILEVPTGQRDVVSQLRQDLEALRDAGVDVTAGQAEALREQIQAFEDAQDAIQRQGRAYQELQDPLGEYLKNLAALNAVLAQHPELADQAAGAQDKLRLAFLDTQNTLDAGIERGLIRLAERFGDFASIAEEAVTDAFVGLEDQFVNVLRGRETDFGGIFDNLLDQAAQVGARAILGPITQSVTEAFKQGILGGSEGAGVGGIFDGFLSGLGGIFSDGEGKGFLSGLGSILEGAGDLFSRIFNSLFGGLGDILGLNGGGFLGGLGSILAGGAEAIGAGVASAAGAIGSALGIGGGAAAAGTSAAAAIGYAGAAGGVGTATAAGTGAAAAATGGAASATSAIVAAAAPAAIAAAFVIATPIVSEALNSVSDFLFGGNQRELTPEERAEQAASQETVDALLKNEATATDLNGSVRFLSQIIRDLENAYSIAEDVLRISLQQLQLFPQELRDALGPLYVSLVRRVTPDEEGFAGGGRIVGPGTGTSDSILARISNGEFIVNAASTRRFLPLLEAINDNGLPRAQAGLPSFRSGLPSFQNGGTVVPFRQPGPSLNVTVINNRPGTAIRVEEGIGDDGERELRVIVDEEVEEAIEDGRFDRAIGRRFGLRARAS